VVQDLLVPLESLDAALNCMHKQFEVYPLWLCPMKVLRRPRQNRALTLGAFCVAPSSRTHTITTPECSPDE
jgi:hypothetical protein